MSNFDGDEDYKMGNDALLAEFRNLVIDREEVIMAVKRLGKIKVKPKKKK